MRNFETKTKLMQHQVDAVNKILPTRVGGLFMEMGTGKSRTAIELVKIRAHKISKAVWFCPVSLKETVQREILKHTTCQPEDIYVFDDKTNGQTIPPAMWYIVGIESMSASARVVSAVNHLIDENTFVICDESSYIKGHNSLRTQRLTMICQRARYRLILTGTPLSQGVVDLYSQMYFLSPRILGYNSFYSFAANHLEYSEKYPGMIVRAHNTEYIAAKIKPYIYQVTKEECLKLPERLPPEIRYCRLTKEQRYWYEWVKEEIFNEMMSSSDDDWFCRYGILRLFTALQEVVSGFLNWKGKFYEFENNRPETMLGFIQCVPENEKTIIFCKFQYDVDVIRKTLAKEYGEDSVVFFDGRVKEKERNRVVEKFEKEARFLIVTLGTGGYGFNWQEHAAYMLFYTNSFNWAQRNQAEGRIERQGQTKPMMFGDIYCVDSIDERIFKAISKKGNTVEEFRREVEKVKKDRIKELIKAL